MSLEKYADCLNACNACADACGYCASSCLREDDVKMMAKCIATDIDCAIICRTAAGFMARGSENVAEICALCAEICDRCAVECSKHAHDHCQKCAEACRHCAAECRKVA
ncbi:four-helix bundle copper-binding protein [soil metagenome]